MVPCNVQTPGILHNIHVYFFKYVEIVYLPAYLYPSTIPLTFSDLHQPWYLFVEATVLVPIRKSLNITIDSAHAQLTHVFLSCI